VTESTNFLLKEEKKSTARKASAVYGAENNLSNFKDLHSKMNVIPTKNERLHNNNSDRIQLKGSTEFQNINVNYI